MLILAAVPSISVLTVTAKAASAGVLHGALTTAGIVLGDIVFILLALFGLVLLVEALGPAFTLVKFAGGGYLVWLGIMMWRGNINSAKAATNHPAKKTSRLSSFMTGLLITLGDQKAILFYLGFLPVFINLSTLTLLDIIIILAITIVAVGGIKLAYVYIAVKAGHVFGSSFNRAMNAVAAIVMLLAGVWVMTRA
jgi:threonine/homoserine/homoserine lactone efflux protein